MTMPLHGSVHQVETFLPNWILSACIVCLNREGGVFAPRLCEKLERLQTIKLLS